MNQQTIEISASTPQQPVGSQLVEINRIGTSAVILSFEISIDPQSAMPADRQRCAALDRAIGQAVREGVDLRGADLSDRDLRYLNLAGLDLSGADLSGSMLDSTILTFANLSGANLRNARMVCGSLSHANLIGASLVGMRISQCDMTGAVVWPDKIEGKATSCKR